MFVAHEVGVGAGELIEITVEEGVFAKTLLLYHVTIISNRILIDVSMPF